VHDLITLTKNLVSIESVTGSEGRVGEYLYEELRTMAEIYHGRVQKMQVTERRFNVAAYFGNPYITFSSHMDTVAPYFGPREDDTYLWGRGACDAKGVIAAMICAVRELLDRGERDLGLLFLVGEEQGSDGARVASAHPVGSRFLINGEPTENKLASASKGVLRYRVETVGRAGHSAYADEGSSAIHLLLDALELIRGIKPLSDPLLGTSSLNIGRISGGSGHNVIAEKAEAEISFRTVGDESQLKEQVDGILRSRAVVLETVMLPAMRFTTVQGFPTKTVAFSTDVSVLTPVWGSALLVGPGSIEVAHSSQERISKKELAQAVKLYKELASILADPGADQVNIPPL
jgi:acetylornithine deacetylase